MNHSTPGLPVHHYLPEFTQTHVHQVGDAIQPSHPLSCLLLLPPIPPSIRVFSNSQFSTSGGQSIGVSASASVRPMNTQDWSFRMDWFDLLAIFRDHLIQLFTDEKMERNIPNSNMKFPYLCTYLSIFSHLVELHLCIQFHSFPKKLLSLMCPCISHPWSSSYPSKSTFPPP